MKETICIRCRKPFGKTDGLVPAKICRSCLSALSSATPEELSRLLEAMGAPAGFVSRDMSLRLSNSLLSRMAEKLTPDLVGVRIGEALECAYVTEHSRCAEHAVCLQCGIRRMMELAWATGDPLTDIPLVLRDRRGTEQEIVFSFARTGDAVLVLMKSSLAEA